MSAVALLSYIITSLLTFDAHCCHIMHPVPDRVKQAFVIVDIRALWRWWLSVRNYRWRLKSQNAL